MQRALVWWGFIAIPKMKQGMEEVADLSGLNHAVQSTNIEGEVTALLPMKKARTVECDISFRYIPGQHDDIYLHHESFHFFAFLSSSFPSASSTSG